MSDDFPIVALVCSAGGLDALTRVLSPLPADLPAAIIALQPQAAIGRHSIVDYIVALDDVPGLLLTLVTAPLIGPSGPDL